MSRTAFPWRLTSGCLALAGAVFLTASFSSDVRSCLLPAQEPPTTPAANNKPDSSNKPDTTAKPDKPDDIDFAKARELFRRRQAGERFSADEEAYVRRAMDARRAMEERRAREGGAGNQPVRRPANVTPRETIGQKPLSEMTADDRYKGEDGGLYGKGRNEPTDAHRRAAEAVLSRIRPLAADGQPDSNGRVVFISISMSNATHPSQSGQNKVARLMLDFYKSDPLAKPWFTGGK